MRKVLAFGIIISAVMVAPAAVRAQADYPFVFYVPEQNEAAKYLALIDNLQKLDDGKIAFNQEWFSRAYDTTVADDKLGAYCFAAYLRQCKNQTVREATLKYIREKAKSDKLSQSLSRLLTAKPVEVVSEGKKLLRFDCGNGLFDEGIAMFALTEYRIFGKLVVEVPVNPWLEIHLKDIKTDKDVAGSDTLGLQMPVGQTNSLQILFTRKQSISAEDFNAFARSSNIQSRYGKSTRIDATGKGVFSNSGAATVLVEYSANQDANFGVQQGTCRVSLYSAKDREGYSSEWYMNFSLANNNFEIRQKLWAQMALISTLCWIDSK